jgi:DNA-binding MarR family transcriptional regulator
MDVKDRRTAPEGLQTLPAYALAQAYRTMRHTLDDSLREIGLTTPQWGTLKCIAESGTVSGAEMARMHHLTPQTMNTILQNLEHGDLIRREHHPANGTVLVLELTELGRERLNEAAQRVLDVQERMLGGFTPEERQTLFTLLNRCVDAFSGHQSGNAYCPDD